MRCVLANEPEVVQWMPLASNVFAVAEEHGVVECFDVRKPDAPLFAWAAHDTSHSVTVCLSARHH